MICPKENWLTLRAFYEQYYRPKKLRTASRHTIEDHRATLNRLQLFLSQDVPLKDLTDRLVEDFLCWLAERGSSAATQNKHLANLRAWWALARRRKIRAAIGEHNAPADDCDVEKVKRPKRTPDAWSEQEVTQLVEQAARTAGSWLVLVGDRAVRIYACDFWPALILFLYVVGPRIEAAMELSVDAVTFFDEPQQREGLGKVGGALHVAAESQKHFADQSTRLPLWLCEALAPIVTPGWTSGDGVRGGKLFPWPYDPHPDRSGFTTLRRRFKKIVKRAGLSTRRLWFHKLRASHGVELENRGGNATESLGHSSRAVTLASYLDPTKSTKPCAAELLQEIKFTRQLRLFG